MSDQYQVALTPMMFLWIGVIVAATVVLLLPGRGRPKATLRLLALTAVGMVSLVCFDYIYPDDQRYTALAGSMPRTSGRPMPPRGWSIPFSTARGITCPLPVPMTSGPPARPTTSIRRGSFPGEKVNLISIQMEAFADLSLYDIDACPRRSTGTSTSSRPRAIPAPSSPTSSPGAPPRPSGLSSPGATSTGILRPRPIPWPGT